MAGRQVGAHSASRQRDAYGRQTLRRPLQLSAMADDKLARDLRRRDHGTYRHPQLRYPVGFADLGGLARRALVDDVRKLRPSARSRQNTLRPQGEHRDGEADEGFPTAAIMDA